MECITSRKGSDMISYEGFLYRKDKTKLNTTNWRCAKTGCKARLTTSSHYREQEEPPQTGGVHSHPPNPTEVAVRKVMNTVKAAAISTLEPPQRIVQDALAEVNEEVAAAIGSYTNLRQTIRRKRKLPHDKTSLYSGPNAKEQCKPGMPKTESSQHGLLLFDSGDEDVNRILIFGSDQLLQTLHDSEHWMCECAIKLPPTPLYEVYTVSASVGNNVVSCVLVLLMNKQTDTYSRMWTEIMSLKPGLSPKSVQIDFELASKTAIAEAFPETRIYGCYFHLGRSLWRNVQENGLEMLYTRDENVQVALKMLVALAFLPEDEVSYAFDELVADYPSEWMPVVNYFEDYYLGRRNRQGDRRQPLFPAHMWSVEAIEAAGLPGVSMVIEGWNNACQGSTENIGTSIFSFIEALRNEDAQAHPGANHTQGRALTKRTEIYSTMNARLAVTLANRDQYDWREFLRCLANDLNIT